MTMLGRYRLEERIGEGAMADVFRAYDESIDRMVAIKVLKEEWSRDAELGARFRREARAAGALSHPNIATVHDVGEVEDVSYIAMELIDGQTLDTALRAHGRFSYERVLGLGVQLASALDYAHRAGIVHRDLKPSNILLTADGRAAKLLDFGVARMDRDAVCERELARTQIGQFMGTPRYMSPEQALGAPVDARSDLFSLGVVLYELVTGKIAFPDTALATLAIKIAQERVEPIERSAADCPPGLRFIIDKLLAKKPEQRFQTAEALRQALERELVSATEASPVRRGMRLRIKLLLFMVTVTGTVLAGSVASVLSHQRQALEHVAIVSGASISEFVTRNSGVLFAENAGLPSGQQDWTTLQAFVASASRDPGIRSMVIADSEGVVRAANDPRLIGHRYARARGERSVDPHDAAGGFAVAASEAPDSGKGGGLRFVRPIRYAGSNFGTVDVVLRRDALDAAISATRNMLIVLSLVVMAVVATVGYLSGALVTRPLARLTKALTDAAESDFALRLSNTRSDEFGYAFEAFNTLAAAIEPRLHREPAMTAEVAVERTRVALPRQQAA